jgi:CRP-like cAMP-binding protein
MAYSFQNKKIEALVTLSAKERYEQLLEEHPALTQKLSNRVLASYLDMSQETLSRLKSRWRF